MTGRPPAGHRILPSSTRRFLTLPVVLRPIGRASQPVESKRTSAASRTVAFWGPDSSAELRTIKPGLSSNFPALNCGATSHKGACISPTEPRTSDSAAPRLVSSRDHPVARHAPVPGRTSEPAGRRPRHLHARSRKLDTGVRGPRTDLGNWCERSTRPWSAGSSTSPTTMAYHRNPAWRAQVNDRHLGLPRRLQGLYTGIAGLLGPRGLSARIMAPLWPPSTDRQAPGLTNRKNMPGERLRLGHLFIPGLFFPPSHAVPPRAGLPKPSSTSPRGPGADRRPTGPSHQFDRFQAPESTIRPAVETMVEAIRGGCPPSAHKRRQETVTSTADQG